MDSLCRILGAFLMTSSLLLAQGGRDKGPSAFLTEAPAQPGSVILARPAATSITLSLLWQGGAEATLVWARTGSALPTQGQPLSLPKDAPREVVLDSLLPDTEYSYALRETATGRHLLPLEGPGRFHTARKPGGTFTFTVTADSHLDSDCLPERYRQTLDLAREAAPDFHIDLGDTFMTEKHPSRESAAAQYAAQRVWLSRVAAPLFLVLGNHDGESRTNRGGDLAPWSLAQRTRLFPNPVPDAFYAGNATPHPGLGPLQDYYTWTWGDALFVVLDPYWHGQPTRGGREPWNMTLGDAQYDWLARTLKGSKARWKFVFIHQLTGSDQSAGRGGAEASAYQEWGGRDLDGTDAFAKHRPHWPLPIHALLVQTGVTAVFHGHDHFFARQERDGVLYQLVPQPAHRSDRGHHAEEYGYKTGTFLPSSGHLRVQVAPRSVTVDYVRTGRDGRGALAASQVLAAR